METLATGIMVVCSLCVTAVAVRNATARPSVAASSNLARSRYLPSWPSYDSIGIQLGPPTAPVHVAEFLDYECPACREFSGVISTIEKQYPSQIQESFIHFPLSIHRFSHPAARAIECAAAQSRFREMRDILFVQQDSFGLKPWSVYARQAGVTDSIRFAACIRDSTSDRRINRGQKLAEALHLMGTPSVMVNGWLFGTPPTREELDAAIRRALAGKPARDSAAGRQS
jgi:protein-disulfide isomerase